ncbi:hypothetical protein DFJ77DRAFT_455016 [Powellomyces hirtus]|nr:hypothetical protein DFJ77DRAFT_455016 [Powellomyces hirtus]
MYSAGSVPSDGAALRPRACLMTLWLTVGSVAAAGPVTLCIMAICILLGRAIHDVSRIIVNSIRSMVKALSDGGKWCVRVKHVTYKEVVV